MTDVSFSKAYNLSDLLFIGVFHVREERVIISHPLLGYDVQDVFFGHWGHVAAQIFVDGEHVLLYSLLVAFHALAYDVPGFKRVTGL